MRSLNYSNHCFTLIIIYCNLKRLSFVPVLPACARYSVITYSDSIVDTIGIILYQIVIALYKCSIYSICIWYGVSVIIENVDSFNIRKNTSRDVPVFLIQSHTLIIPYNTIYMYFRSYKRIL